MALSWRSFFDGNRRALEATSLVLIPVALVALVILALLDWPSRSLTQVPSNLDITAMSFVPDDTGITPDAARAALRTAKTYQSFDTALSESPVWFSFTAPTIAPDDQGPPRVYFASRHVLNLSCWYGEALAPLGNASLNATSGFLVQARSAFATSGIDLSNTSILCRGTYRGPARVAVSAWSAKDFAKSQDDFTNGLGQLEGGIAVLAIFMLLAAAVNREPVYLVFAAWLIVSGRVGANSAGWDFWWFGQKVPSGWLDMMRKFGFAFNFPLTAYLFLRLFKVELEKLGAMPLQRALELIYIPFMLGLLLPYKYFILLLWGGAFVGYLIIIYFLRGLIFVTKSRIALWFALSLIVTAVASFTEVLRAAFGLPGALPYVNSVTSALAAALLAAMAVVEQLRAERVSREEVEAALRKTYNQVPVAFFTASSAGVFERGNPALLKLLGEAVIGRRWKDMFAEGSWEELLVMLGDEREEAKLRFLDRHSAHWYEVRASRRAQIIEGSIEDVSDVVLANSQLIYLAERDALTQVFNRRAIEQHLEVALSTVSADKPVALVYMDLDRFKTVNDLFGHAAGDEVLRQFSTKVARELGADHPLGRVGGDEFLIIMRGITVAQAASRCRELVDMIDADPFKVNDLAFRIGASFGVVEVSQGVTTSDLIAAADRACREAKSVLSSGHVVAYSADAPAFQEHDEERMLIGDLTSGKAPRILSLAMQPVMSLDDPQGALDFEVLLRVKAADGTSIPTARAIAIAEVHGKVGMIDRWVLQSVLEWIDANAAYLTRTRFISINFSGSSINDEQFMEDAYALLREHPLAAQRICIEITEGVALRDFDQTRRMLDRLRELNVKLALDDFGAGYTSFMYLVDLQVDVIKIDGTIIESSASHPSRLSIVQAIADLSRNLGMRCVAECVEDAPTLRAMAEVGVNYVQGYAIARPMSPAELLRGTHAAQWISDAPVRAVLAETHAAQLANGEAVVLTAGKNLH